MGGLLLRNGIVEPWALRRLVRCYVIYHCAAGSAKIKYPNQKCEIFTATNGHCSLISSTNLHMDGYAQSDRSISNGISEQPFIRMTSDL